MLTKKNFVQCKIILEGTLIVSNLKMINKMLTFPLEEFLRTPMNDRAFSLPFFRAFTHYELFISFRSLNFSCNINRIKPLVVIIYQNYLQ